MVLRRSYLPTVREYLRVIERYGSYMGKKIDLGKLFKVYIGKYELGAGDTLNIYFDNSNNENDILISVLSVEADGRARVKMIKGVTISDYGTELDPIPYVIGDGYSTNVRVYQNVNYNGGVVIDGGQIQSQLGRKGFGGDQEFNIVFKVRSGYGLLIEVENEDSVDINVDVRVIFHEE